MRLVMMLAMGVIGSGAVQGPYPPPAGYRWQYVTENNNRTTENNNLVVELRKIT